MSITIAIVGCLDTKGEETGFLREVIESTGNRAWIIDTGVLEPPAFEAAASAGYTIGTEIATTSGTAATFTGIPSGTKRIIMNIAGFSQASANGDIVCRIGDAGGIEEGFSVIKRCVETIFTTDGEVHELRDATEKEADEFFESLTSDQFQKIRDFFDSMPKLSHKVKFKCTGCKKENVRTLEGMASFFG